MNAIERLKEELDLFSPEQPMITVSRKDLETLIREYEALKEQRKNECS